VGPTAGTEVVQRKKNSSCYRYSNPGTSSPTTECSVIIKQEITSTVFCRPRQKKTVLPPTPAVRDLVLNHAYLHSAHLWIRQIFKVR
jgi:hypothetical protein